MDEYTRERFVYIYDMLVKWQTRADGFYCPVDILSINTSFAPGPLQDRNKVVGDRSYDYYYLYALLDDRISDIKEEISNRGHMHPSDEAFWKEALDRVEVGSVFSFASGDNEPCHLYHEFLLPSHNHKELCREIDQLEQYFRAQRPNSNLEFRRPHNSGSGCYVATAVYGSYDCPEVWTLRRFRDQRLAETAFGRAFIRLYYAVSPTVVRWFGKTAAFNRFFRKRLDRLVVWLQREGMESTPYRDK